MSTFKYSTSSYRDFPATAAAADKSPRSYILHRPQFKSGGVGGGRIRQIILTNKKSLNNAVDSLKTNNNSIDTFSSSYYRMPHLETRNSDSMLVKSPFKHTAKSSKTASSNGTLLPNGQRINSAKTMSNASSNNYATLKPIRGLDNFSQFNIYNPSTSLVLKTAHSINEFVDFFEKNRFNSNHLPRIKKGVRSSNYSGLKPLSFVEQTGPNIKNCLGVIKEPKNDNAIQLRDIYEQKLKLLEQKRAMESQKVASSMTIEEKRLSAKSIKFSELDF